MMQKTAISSWAKSEFGQANFNDTRLTNRLIKLADHFGNIPESPINQACGTWSEAKAAYRFLKNDCINQSEILATHVDNTIVRCEKHRRVIAIQDTSYICYKNHNKTTGLGSVAQKTGRNTTTRCTIYLTLTDNLSALNNNDILQQQKIIIVKKNIKYIIYCKSKKNEKNIIQIDVDTTDENLFNILNQEDFTNEFILKKNIKDNKEFYNLVCAKIETNNGYTNKSISVKGLIMHTAFAVNQEGLPLGILDQKIYSRSNEEIKSLENKNDPHVVSIENKESIKWLKSLKNSTNNIDIAKTKIVTVCDREADIYDFFELADNLKSDILVRAAQDRVINKKNLHAKKDNQKLWSVIEGLPCQGVIDVEVPLKNNQPKRTAHLEVRFGKFTMNPPKKNIRNKTENLSNLSIYAVYIIEKHSPEGTDPLEWMLLTNISVNNFDEAIEKVRWYCLRWKIEIFHKILKSGLKVESCRLSTAERLIRYLTVMSIIAWRVFFITLISRVDPNLPCTIVLDEEEFRVLYAKMYLTKFSSNTEIPTIKKVITWIAQLGGYLARNNDPPPGPIVVWRGWKRLFDLTEGWKLFGMINTCG